MQRSLPRRSNVHLAQSLKGGPEPLPRVALSVGEFCESMGIGRTKLYELIKQRQIRPVKLGKRTLIPVAERDAFLARLAGEVA